MAKHIEAQVTRGIGEPKRQELWQLWYWHKVDGSWVLADSFGGRAYAEKSSTDYRTPTRIVHFVLE